MKSRGNLFVVRITEVKAAYRNCNEKHQPPSGYHANSVMIICLVLDISVESVGAEFMERGICYIHGRGLDGKRISKRRIYCDTTPETNEIISQPCSIKK